jgi:hypothetical protein
MTQLFRAQETIASADEGAMALLWRWQRGHHRFAYEDTVSRTWTTLQRLVSRLKRYG